MDTPFNAKLAISTPFGLYDSPNGGKRLPCVSVEWHRARMAMAVPCGYNLAEIRCDGWEIGEARCKVVSEARERKIKYLFFLDWDVLIPATTLVRLVYLAENNPEYDVVSGIYCMKQDPPEVLVWRGEWGNGISWDWTLGDILTDVVGVGTGCMLIRMSVFDKLDPSIPYFKTSTEHNENQDGSFTRKEMTDDIWFCKRVIEEAKSQILVDTGILCGHIDNETGVVYTLPDDCLPMKRYNAKLAGVAA